MLVSLRKNGKEEPRLLNLRRLGSPRKVHFRPKITAKIGTWTCLTKVICGPRVGARGLEPPLGASEWPTLFSRSVENEHTSPRPLKGFRDPNYWNEGSNSEAPNRRSFKGQHDWGQQAWEVLRGKSASERVPERTSERDGFRAFQSFSEVFRGFQRFSEIFRGFQRFFRGFSKALSETLSECHFPLRAAGRVAPNRVAP